MRNLFYFRCSPSSIITNPEWNFSQLLNSNMFFFLFLVRVVYKITTLCVCVCVIYKNLNASGVDVGKSHTRIELKYIPLSTKILFLI